MTHREIKGRSFVEFGLRPDLTSMLLNNALHSRQTHPCAFEIFWAMQPLEDAKELVGVLHAESDSVVTDVHDSVPILFFLAHFD